jgi:hypothetical protein
MKAKVISYYCDVDPNDTYYSDHAAKFIENMHELDIPFYVEHIISLGSYRSNCLFKPKFIKKCLEKFDTSLIWLDIDSKVHSSIDIIDSTDADIVLSTNSMNEHGEFIPKASPIFMKNNIAVKNFIDAWIDRCEFYLKTSNQFFDHEILLEVLKESKLNIGLVGFQYCAFAGQIFTNEEPIITMGISSGESKSQGLIDMGVTPQRVATEAIRKTYYTHNGTIK